MLEASIAGASLASLLFDIECAREDIEGFLFGTVSQVKFNTLEDDSTNNIVTDTVIAIQSYYKTGQPGSFYDAFGNLDVEKIKSVLSGRQSLLGWFKYRKGAVQRPSIRELAVHYQLDDLYAKYQKSKRSARVPLIFNLFRKKKYNWKCN